MIRNRRLLSLFLGLCTTAAVAFAGESAPPQAERAKSAIPQTAPAPEIATREAVCHWADHPPVLDGKLDDPCWKAAKPIDRFASFWTKTPRQGTTAYLVWDAAALYYAARMTDLELRSFGSKRNDILWNGDVFELFFKPNAQAPAYYEFQANPRELVFELAFPERGHNHGDIARTPPLGSKVAVSLEGTLDHPGDQDAAWIVEGRIPWTAFAPTGGKPSPGDEWRFALCRYDYGPDGTKPVLSSSAPLTKPSFHRHEDYGLLKFAGAK